MARYNLFRFFLCRYACPHRHEAAPYAEPLYEAVVLPRLPDMEEQLAGLHAVYCRCLDRQQVEVNAVVEAVALVPAMLTYARFQRLGFTAELSGNLLHLQTCGEIVHCAQLFVHQGVEED